MLKQFRFSDHVLGTFVFSGVGLGVAFPFLTVPLEPAGIFKRPFIAPGTIPPEVLPQIVTTHDYLP